MLSKNLKIGDLMEGLFDCVQTEVKESGTKGCKIFWCVTLILPIQLCLLKLKINNIEILLHKQCIEINQPASIIQNNWSLMIKFTWHIKSELSYCWASCISKRYVIWSVIPLLVFITWTSVYVTTWEKQWSEMYWTKYERKWISLCYKWNIFDI